MTATMERTTEAPTEANAPYGPLGGFRDFMRCRDPFVVLEGPAGTGKSRAAFEKIHRACEKYDGARVLYVRNTRRSCTDSGLVTFEEKVLPAGHYLRQGPKRDQRHSYRYSNGSELVVGGLDEPTKLYSTEYDIVFVQEVNECLETQVAPLIRCMRNGKMPYQQIIADLNPTEEDFWLYEWEQAKRATFFQTKHADNPTLTDDYLAALAGLPAGPLRDSLYLGLRVAQVQGAYFAQMLYEAKHAGRIDNRWGYNPDLNVHVGLDLGVEDYTVLWFFQMAPDGRRYFLDCLEHNGEGMGYYAMVIADRAREGRWTIGRLILPHDGNQRKQGEVIETPASVLEGKGFQVDVVTPAPALENQIEAAREALPMCYFHADRCKGGLQRLRNYRRDMNIRTGIYGRPVHDAASHAASAFMTSILGSKPEVKKKAPDKPNRYGTDYGGPGGSVY
jgi:phage terminase large subunit